MMVATEDGMEATVGRIVPVVAADKSDATVIDSVLMTS